MYYVYYMHNGYTTFTMSIVVDVIHCILPAWLTQWTTWWCVRAWDCMEECGHISHKCNKYLTIVTMCALCKSFHGHAVEPEDLLSL